MNLYPIYIITKIVVLVSEPVRGDLGRPSCLVSTQKVLIRLLLYLTCELLLKRG